MAEEKEEIKIGSKKINFKIFDMWDISEIKINDFGLKNVINLEPKLVLKSEGRNVVKHGQTKVNIVERLVNKIALTGHRGKKHKIELGHATGKYSKNMKIVLEAFKVIEKRTGKNPVEILVRAIEKVSPRDETTIIEYGGARYPQAVDVSPIRRVNLALKSIVHGASDKSFGKKKKFSQTLAEEIILAYEENGESSALKKKKESEAQADSAR
ncbi:30S ribosomal protein S7 [Candidatus Pacearchaeota archaeon CG10_big_fil_rev_8_21_14_0_10_32_42]|nr:MAG: 30S ribosomal protein S7 [Candidatus Pacearchaeota archaeon CG10_big_fil_rev_8_21_14_0_10_32_42]